MSRQTEPSAPPAPSVQYERPDSPLARGAWSVPGWVVGTLGGALLVAVALFFWLRHRRHTKLQGPPHSLPPPSSRAPGR